MYSQFVERSSALIELGRRLHARKTEAGLSEEELGTAAGLAPSAVALFEAGRGNLGAAPLLRVARVLGVPAGELLSPSHRETKARVSPAVLLRTKRVASLSTTDENAIELGLRRAADFAGLGEILKSENLTREFGLAPAPAFKAHEPGYALALKVRTRLGREGALRDLGRLVEERFNILVLRHAFSNPAIEGAACRSGDARLILLNENLQYETRRRAVLAHEVAHHLVDLNEDDITTDERDPESGFTLENTPEEKRANAFAVMLLAPSNFLRTLLGEPRQVSGGAAASDLITRGRTALGLGAKAMGWHLFHLGYIANEFVVQDATRGAYEDATGFEDVPKVDGLERRVREALARELISLGRARELLGIPPYEDLPEPA